MTIDRWLPISKAELKKLYHCNHPESSASSSEVLFEGFKMLEEALHFPHLIRAVYALEPLSDFELPDTVKCYIVSEREARSFSNFETFPSVACRVELEYSSPVRSDENAVFLHRISDPGNAGTMIRTADWFGVPKVILSHSVSLFNHKLIHASMGSVLRVGVVKNDDLARLSASHSVYVSDLTGTAVEEVEVRAPWVLCIGNESRGTQGLDITGAIQVTIPRVGTGIDSLNAAVSCGVLLDRFRTGKKF